MESVCLSGVGKVYDNGFVAVRDANLVVEDGEFLVLVGPSGCGKSTLLRMIAGLESITEGELHIGGRLVNSVAPKDRDIAMVFQNYALYPHLTVFENIAFGLKLRKYAKSEIRGRFMAAAEILGLVDILDNRPKELSGGQRQRVAVGRAIVRQPKVFLFDEPLSNLDAKLRVQMRAEIRALHARLGSTMIYVTHDQVEAMTMGDRIAVMRGGIIEQIDTPLNLYDFPVNRFVAGFIGSPSMNFFEGSIVPEGGAGVFREHGGGISVMLSTQTSARLADVAGGRVILGIRPEDIYTVDSDDAGAEHRERAISVVPDLIEQMGNEMLVHATTPSGAMVARVTRESILDPLGALGLVFDPAKLHFFHRETGRSIGQTTV